MPLIFSPLSDETIDGPFEPKPRHAFLMVQSGEGISQLELKMEEIVCHRLQLLKFFPVKASSERGTKDYLEKIIGIIRGIGFGVAIFSEYTPASTMANIFFEVGMCGFLGKPVVILKSEKAPVPSDFVRNEWIKYIPEKDHRLGEELDEALRAIEDQSIFFETLGEIALESQELDAELAFERLKQAFLIGGRRKTQQKIGRLNDLIHNQENTKALLLPTEKRLKSSILQFVKLSP